MGDLYVVCLLRARHLTAEKRSARLLYMSEEALLDDKKEYEITFIAAAEDGAIEVEKELAAFGCALTGKGPLAAIKLAYPVKKHASGHFGYVWFTALADDVKKLHDALAIKPGILRFLIVTPPVKVTVRENRTPRERGMQPKPAASEAPKEAPVSEPRPQAVPMRVPEALSNELLERKLEEILK